MADINATEPVVVPAVGSVTFDKWYLTQLIAKIGPDAAPVVVRLHRSAVVDGKTVLMPGRMEGSDVSFTMDLWKEMANFPQIASAMNGVVDAVVAFASSKNLI